MTTERKTHRVIKTLAPTDRGAIALAQHYGDALICVRHRTDAKGRVRYTTVELLVQSVPVKPRSVHEVRVKIAPHERALHAMVKAAGGRWDPTAHVWRLPSRVASILHLRNRIVQV